MAVTMKKGKTLAKGETVVKSAEGDENSTQELVEMDIPEVLGVHPMGSVGMEMSNTINTGNYNSVRVQVSIVVPCEVNPEDLSGADAAFQVGYDWVGEKLGQVIEDIDEQLN